MLIDTKMVIFTHTTNNNSLLSPPVPRRAPFDGAHTTAKVASTSRFEARIISGCALAPSSRRSSLRTTKPQSPHVPRLRSLPVCQHRASSHRTHLTSPHLTSTSPPLRRRPPALSSPPPSPTHTTPVTSHHLLNHHARSGGRARPAPFSLTSPDRHRPSSLAASQ